MSLKEKLDRFRSDSPSRFTEEQRRIMRRFQDNVDGAQDAEGGGLSAAASSHGRSDGTSRDFPSAGPGLLQGGVVRLLRSAVAGL